MYAVGVDYDISSKTSVHLRTKYMDHKDNNFTLDKFSGFETTFELKIFL
jgi:predicted porin